MKKLDRQAEPEVIVQEGAGDADSFTDSDEDMRAARLAKRQRVAEEEGEADALFTLMGDVDDGADEARASLSR